MAGAITISHATNDLIIANGGTVAVTPAFGTLVSGGTVGTAAIDFGVDYSSGGVEGIFLNGGSTHGLGGINASNVLDLVTGADATIVLVGTTTPGLTSLLTVEAGFSGNGSLTLEVFDSGGFLITSTTNGPPLGPFGRTTMTIDRGGVFDIASFRVSGADTWGINSIVLENPVPEPSTLALLGMGLAGLALRRRRRE